MDGYLKIKTKIDNKGIDRDIQEIEEKIKKMQTNNSALSTEQTGLEQEIRNYEKLHQEAGKYQNTLKNLKMQKEQLVASNVNLTVGTSGELQALESQITSMQNKYIQTSKEIDKQAPKIERVYAKLDKVKAKQSENNIKISQFKDKIESINISKIESGINNVGKNIQNQIGKIGKMTLAVIGIRTAWQAVRSAISLVSQYNEQVSADFEYMRFAIAQLLVPAVQWLVSLLYTALGYINAILSAWFGINLFANASASAFQKMRSGASATAKSAKEIQKSLQGFDEMNILQAPDNSSGGSGGGTGGAMPSMDLSKIQGNVPEWLKWIIDNKDLILGLIAGIAGGLLALKLGFGALTSLGIGMAIFGIIEIISSLNDLISGDFVNGLKKYLIGLTALAVGVGLIFGFIPGLVVAIIGAVALAGITLHRYEKEIRDMFDNLTNMLMNVIDKDWREMFGPLVGTILNQFVKQIKVMIEMAKTMLDGILMFLDGIFTGDIKKIFQGIMTFFSGWWGMLITIAMTPISTLTGIIKGFGADIKSKFADVFNFLYGLFQNLWSYISNFFGSLYGWAFNVGVSIGNVISGAFRSVVNSVLGTIENILNTPIRGINTLVGVVNSLPTGFRMNYLSTFSLPRLAKGGIVAKPTQAIIGEAGKEAVMPLENNLEWLDILADKLSQRIGNNGGNVNVYLDGRLIQRQIAKREQQLAFATNGR